MFFTVSGCAHVVKNNSVIRVCRAGSWFGELALIDSGRRAATVLAEPGDTEILTYRLTRAALDSIDPSICATLGKLGQRHRLIYSASKPTRLDPSELCGSSDMQAVVPFNFGAHCVTAAHTRVEKAWCVATVMMINCVRASFDIESPAVGDLAEGEYFQVLEEKFDSTGQLHVRMQWPDDWEHTRWQGQPDEVEAMEELHKEEEAARYVASLSESGDDSAAKQEVAAELAKLRNDIV